MMTYNTAPPRYDHKTLMFSGDKDSHAPPMKLVSGTVIQVSPEPLNAFF